MTAEVINNIQPNIISSVTLLVNDYDEAIAFYVNKLKFTLVADMDIGEGKRWVQLMPVGSLGTALALALADNEQMQNAVGNQAGGQVFMIMQTDDFWRDYQFMQHAGVHFEEQPREEVYGTVAIFTDLYGNRWDLIEPKN